MSSHAERIPDTGGFILVSNHPTGIADGVAVFDLLKSKRPDIMVFANRDAVRVNPRFAEVIIPVEWREEYKSKLKTRETLQMTNHAVREGKATVLFPSGRIAYWANGRLNERPWKTSAVGLARKYNLPILPVHMTARNSGLFYWFAKWSTELRDMTVFHELLNKRGDRFDFVIGNLIPVEHLDGDINEVTKALEDHTVLCPRRGWRRAIRALVPPAEPELAGAHSFRLIGSAKASHAAPLDVCPELPIAAIDPHGSVGHQPLHRRERGRQIQSLSGAAAYSGGDARAAGS